MKTIALAPTLAAAAIGLFASGSAFAQNKVEITQTGIALVATTTQQNGTNGKIQLTQSGHNNSAVLLQEDVDFGQLRGSGAATAAFIDQVGHDNKINADITPTTPKLGQREEASFQQNLVVQVSQDGYLNNVSYDQRGDGNQLKIVQKLHGNQAAAAQYQNGNYMSVTQQGTDGAVRVRQIGDDGNLTVNQSGAQNQLAALQSGEQDYADLYQSGANNYAAINQYGDHDEALLNQHGDNGFVLLQQNSAGAVADLAQYGGQNTIVSTQ